jgi:hypothetical protein
MKGLLPALSYPENTHVRNITITSYLTILTIRAKEEIAKMVRLNDDVHEDLTSLGAKNESYSKIVRRLINHYKQSVKK